MKNEKWFIAYSSSMLDCTWNIKTLKQELTIQNHNTPVKPNSTRVYAHSTDENNAPVRRRISASRNPSVNAACLSCLYPGSRYGKWNWVWRQMQLVSAGVHCWRTWKPNRASSHQQLISSHCDAVRQSYLRNSLLSKCCRLKTINNVAFIWQKLVK